MAIEAEYYRRVRHKCREWRYLGVEEITERDAENTWFDPSKVGVGQSEDGTYANVFIENKGHRGVGASLLKDGEWERVDTRMPLLLLPGQTLELWRGDLSMNLRFLPIDANMHSERNDFDGMRSNQIQELS